MHNAKFINSNQHRSIIDYHSIYLLLMHYYFNQFSQFFLLIIQMLTVSFASVLFASALFLYDLSRHRQNKKNQQILQEKKHKYRSIRILLTGGPCGGKSQGINCIYHSFKQIAAPFFIVPQAATIIGSAGLTLDLSQFKPRQIELFQINLMKLQYNLEQIILSIASNLQKLEKTPVVLCDRGLLDGKAYAGQQNWAKMLKQVNITEKEILSRYKAAIHMVTAAKGAQNHYIYSTEDDQPIKNGQVENEGLKVRKEPPQIAKDLDFKIQQCYRDHPNRYIISNQFFVKNFEDKKTVLLAQVCTILSQIIQSNDLSEYYNDYENLRKNSEQNINNLTSAPSPYLIRKRKFKKFIRKTSPLKNNTGDS